MDIKHLLVSLHFYMYIMLQNHSTYLSTMMSKTLLGLAFFKAGSLTAQRVTSIRQESR
jgi:hypothetical protein